VPNVVEPDRRETGLPSRPPEPVPDEPWVDGRAAFADEHEAAVGPVLAPREPLLEYVIRKTMERERLSYVDAYDLVVKSDAGRAVLGAYEDARASG